MPLFLLQLRLNYLGARLGYVVECERYLTGLGFYVALSHGPASRAVGLHRRDVRHLWQGCAVQGQRFKIDSGFPGLCV